jgi:hypothetical protein
MRDQSLGDGGARGRREFGGASGEVQLAVGVGAAEEQYLRRVEGADDAADDCFGGEAGPQLL